MHQESSIQRLTATLFVLFVSAGCVGEPSLDSGQLPTATPARDRIILFVHGGKDSPETWALGARARIETQLPEPARWSSMVVDWEHAASNNLTSARRGLLLGEELGKELLAQPEPFTHVVIVAHSVGAFVSHGMCEVLAKSDDVVVHQIMLDPFGMRRAIDRDFGEGEFGACADYAEAYINTDDNAPTTDTPMPGMFTIDVTNARPDDYDPERHHWWPIDAWLDLSGTERREHVLGVESIWRALESPGELRALQPPGRVIAL